MEEQNTKPISNREQLLFLASSIILAGICSNYSTIGPSSSHILVARCAAKDLLDSILAGKRPSSPPDMMLPLGRRFLLKTEPVSLTGNSAVSLKSLIGMAMLSVLLKP